MKSNSFFEMTESVRGPGNMNSTSQPIRTNLLGLERSELEAFFSSIGEKPFRARQVMKWIYQAGVDCFDQMTDLSTGLRDRLSEIAEIRPPQVLTRQDSTDGTRKWLFGTDENNGIETVYIPERTRGTLCISSQVGCVLDCTFCSTAQQGINRNLSAAEIIGQVWLANRELGCTLAKMDIPPGLSTSWLHPRRFHIRALAT